MHPDWTAAVTAPSAAFATMPLACGAGSPWASTRRGVSRHEPPPSSDAGCFSSRMRVCSAFGHRLPARVGGSAKRITGHVCARGGPGGHVSPDTTSTTYGRMAILTCELASRDRPARFYIAVTRIAVPLASGGRAASHSAPDRSGQVQSSEAVEQSPQWGSGDQPVEIAGQGRAIASGVVRPGRAG
jgi:hypothetical protein